MWHGTNVCVQMLSIARGTPNDGSMRILNSLLWTFPNLAPIGHRIWCQAIFAHSGQLHPCEWVR